MVEATRYCLLSRKKEDGLADAGVAAVKINAVFAVAVMNGLGITGQTALVSLRTGVDLGAEGDVVIRQTDVPAVEIINIDPDSGERIQIIDEVQQLLIVKRIFIGNLLCE